VASLPSRRCRSPEAEEKTDGLRDLDRKSSDEGEGAIKGTKLNFNVLLSPGMAMSDEIGLLEKLSKVFFFIPRKQEMSCMVCEDNLSCEAVAESSQMTSHTKYIASSIIA